MCAFSPLELQDVFLFAIRFFIVSLKCHCTPLFDMCKAKFPKPACLPRSTFTVHLPASF